MAVCKAAVFDLGGVLIEWDPGLPYRKMLRTQVAFIDDHPPNVEATQ